MVYSYLFLICYLEHLDSLRLRLMNCVRLYSFIQSRFPPDTHNFGMVSMN